MKSLLWLALSGLIAVARVEAVPVELATSTKGSGSVQIGSTGERVSQVNVILKRDGRFTIGLVGENDTRFTGTWQPSGRDKVLLRVSGANERSVRGGGELDLRSLRSGYEVDRITLSGENDKERAFSARFAAPRYAPAPPPPPRLVLDSERSGAGRLQVGGRTNSRIDRVHVQLLTNDRAHVHTEGAAALRYEGTWTSSGDTTATLDVRGGLDGERLQGIVRHRSGRFWRIELTGTRGSRYYSLEFEPGQ